MTKSMKTQARLQALVILIACAATLACVQKPVVPSGAARVPINSDEMIQQYRERVKNDQRERQERSLLTRQVDSLTQQVQELNTALTLVQLQQHELAKGKSRSGPTITKTALTIPLVSPDSKGPLTSTASSPESGTLPVTTEQSVLRTETIQSEDERSTSVGPACSAGRCRAASGVNWISWWPIARKRPSAASSIAGRPGNAA